MILNYVFASVIFACIFSQGLKILLRINKEKRAPHLTDLVLTGGMPSTHSSMASSLFASLILVTGFSSLTAIGFVVFIIVITDSMGVRRSVGEEGKILNKIIKIEKLKIHEVNYSLGHKPIEVLIGIIIGFGISLVLYFFVLLS